MKKFFALCALLLLLFCLPVQARQTYLFDLSDTLSPAEQAQVESDLATASQKAGRHIGVVFTDSYEPYYSITAYGDAFNEEELNNASGILLVIDLNDREFATVTSGDTEAMFSDDALYDLEDVFIPLLQKGDHAAAASTFGKKAASHIVYQTNPFAVQKIFVSLAVGLGVGAIVALIRTSVLKKKLRSVHPDDRAEAYVCPGSFALKVKRDQFLYSNLVKIPRNTDTDNRGGGGGGGGHHISSGGFSHGGHSGRF